MNSPQQGPYTATILRGHSCTWLLSLVAAGQRGHGKGKAG